MKLVSAFIGSILSLAKKHVEWASVSAAAITETLTEAINETCFEVQYVLHFDGICCSGISAY